MLVSHRKKFIYLKTKKTAGTSIEMALEPYARPEDTQEELEHTTQMSVTDAGIVGARGKGSKRQMWSSHMPASKVKTQLGDEIWNSYTKICGVRNPWDKVVSFYHMRYPNIKDRRPRHVFTRFREWVAETEKFGEDLDIYTINGEPVIDEYIRYENLDEEFARVCNRIGVPPIKLEVMKGQSRGENKIDYRKYYDERSKDIVAERYARDIAMLNWTFD